jgi:hypothetical protein
MLAARKCMPWTWKNPRASAYVRASVISVASVDSQVRDVILSAAKDLWIFPLHFPFNPNSNARVLRGLKATQDDKGVGLAES